MSITADSFAMNSLYFSNTTLLNSAKEDGTPLAVRFLAPGK